MKIAFVCNGNSFKSIIAERFGNQFNTQGIFEIYSAGVNPADEINRDGKEIMRKKGISMEGYSPKSMDKLPLKLDVLVKMGCDIQCPIHMADRVIDFGLENISDKEKCIELIEIKVKELLNSLEKNISKDCWENIKYNSGIELNRNKKIEDNKEENSHEYTCYCDEVTEKDIISAVHGGAKTFEEVLKITGAMKNSNCLEKNPKGICCGKDIMEIIKKYS